MKRQMSRTWVSCVLLVCCLLWSACVGVILPPDEVPKGKEPPATTEPVTQAPKDGGQVTPDSTLADLLPDDHPDASKPDASKPEVGPEKVPSGNAVYYSDVKPFFDSFCVACHSDPKFRPFVSNTYHDDSCRLDAKAKWAEALQYIKGGSMPKGGRPDTGPSKKLFDEGLALVERWAKAGFPESPKPSSAPKCPVDKDPNTHFPQTGTCKGKEPLPSRIWRLTAAQMRNAILDVFGPDSIKGLGEIKFSGLDKDQSHGFDNNGIQTFSATDLSHLVSRFEAFASYTANRGTSNNCHKGGNQSDACIIKFIATYGRKLWRRTPTEQEKQGILGETKSVIQQTKDWKEGMKYLTQRLLTSPHFLYRFELGEPIPGQPGFRRLTSHEVASSLSFFVWQSVPDDILLKAADDNLLSTRAQVRQQLDRMSKDPRAKRGIKRFILDWLDLELLKVAERETRLFPLFKRGKIEGKALLQSVSMFIDNVVWNKKGTLRELFTSTEMFVNNFTAELYGLQQTDTSFKMIKADPKRRAGILTTPGYLVAVSGRENTSFVHRGVFFLDSIVCKSLKTPPGLNVLEEGEKNLGGKSLEDMTQREIQELHSQSPACHSCHQHIDPIGAAFEVFDAIGRYRTTEKKKPIDATGKLKDVGENKESYTFNNAVDLVKNISKSIHFQQCYAKKFYTFATGTQISANRTCGLAQLHNKLQQEGFVLQKAYEAVLDMDNFFLRKDIQSTGN